MYSNQSELYEAPATEVVEVYSESAILEGSPRNPYEKNDTYNPFAG